MTLTEIAMAMALPLLSTAQMPQSGATVKNKAKAKMEKLDHEVQIADREAKREAQRKARNQAKLKATQDAQAKRKAKREAQRKARNQAKLKAAQDAQAARREQRKARRQAQRERAQARVQQARARIQTLNPNRRADIQQELRTHLRRMAQLDRIKELAQNAGDTDTEKRARTLLAKEKGRHEARMKVFERQNPGTAFDRPAKGPAR